MPPPVTKQAEQVLTAEALRKAIEEAKKDYFLSDSSKEGIFQASLSARGWESKDIPSEFLDVEFLLQL